MKRLYVLLLVLTLALALPGCSESQAQLTQDDPASQFPPFSYQEETQLWKKDEPGVCYGGFQNTVEAEGLDADGIVERAKKECTVVYDTAVISGYDSAEDMWRVEFYTSGTAGGGQTVYLDGRGVTHLIVYGE